MTGQEPVTANPAVGEVAAFGVEAGRDNEDPLGEPPRVERSVAAFRLVGG